MRHAHCRSRPLTPIRATEERVKLKQRAPRTHSHTRTRSARPHHRHFGGQGAPLSLARALGARLIRSIGASTGRTYYTPGPPAHDGWAAKRLCGRDLPYWIGVARLLLPAHGGLIGINGAPLRSHRVCVSVHTEVGRQGLAFFGDAGSFAEC